MIRLRIERDDPDDIQMQDGIWYWENGGPVGRVIIEELPDAIRADLSYNGASNPFMDEPEWVPVEVIDDN